MIWLTWSTKVMLSTESLPVTSFLTLHFGRLCWSSSDSKTSSVTCALVFHLVPWSLEGLKGGWVPECSGAFLQGFSFPNTSTSHSFSHFRRHRFVYWSQRWWRWSGWNSRDTQITSQIGLNYSNRWMWQTLFWWLQVAWNLFTLSTLKGILKKKIHVTCPSFCQQDSSPKTDQKDFSPWGKRKIPARTCMLPAVCFSR